MIKLIFIFEGVLGLGSSLEILIEEKLLIENEDLLFLIENIDLFVEIEINIFKSFLFNLDILKSVLYLIKNKKRR